MGTKLKEKSNVKETAKPAKKLAPFVYASEDVKNYSFSDRVRVTTSLRGMLLSFGKQHPESEKNVIYNEILIPLEVAFSLQNIMVDQFEQLKNKNLIRETEKTPNGKKGDK